MSESTVQKIVVLENGPYLVSGSVPVAIETMEPIPGGESWTWQAGRAVDASERYALCRCGQSSTKPFCDGTHKQVGFDGTETASRAPFAEQAERTDGPAYVLEDAKALCSFARFCDNYGTIWERVTEDSADAREVVLHEATHCPSGRLVVRDKRTGAAVEPAFEPSISLVEDAGKDCSGPLWVKGGITVESADGRAYEVRNRVALCRCGASQNKPFCDGTHVDVAFKDGLA